jgi:type II secretory pathway pseudopilin PulG
MKKALTIGELLVTMAILGVIATLVLPRFLKDYHKNLYVTKLKKVTESLENAMNQACVDNNVSYFVQTIYSKSSDGSNQQAFIDKYFKKVTVGKNEKPFAATYSSISGTSGVANLVAQHGYAKLASGEAISLFCHETTSYCVFRVDVNSTDGPNIGGRDMFMITIDKATNKLYDNADSAKCTSKVLGEGCFGKLLEDNWEMTY